MFRKRAIISPRHSSIDSPANTSKNVVSMAPQNRESPDKVTKFASPTNSGATPDSQEVKAIATLKAKGKTEIASR